MQAGTLGSTLTSMKVGGPVASFWQPSTEADLAEALAYADERSLPVKVIGGGSDLLLADEGLAGVLIRPAFKQLARTEGYAEELSAWLNREETPGRYRAQEHPDFLALDEREAEVSGEPVLVEMGAGVPWGQAVSWSLREKLSGLQWYARIPCHVGGAAYNNIHGQKHLLSESVVAVRALDPGTGSVRLYPHAELDFGYDRSRFHGSGEIILSVILALHPSLRPEDDQRLYLEWTKEKARVQPSGANSGSTFKNLTPEQAEAIGQDALAAGWYVDQCGLKGRQVGGMQVYPGHGNFVVNLGGGTQADFIALLTEIRSTVWERFRVMLEPEVECVNEQGQTYQWPKTQPTGSY
jgi:UDP-N-acetylenolpyruvoylglucosamine reductase